MGKKKDEKPEEAMEEIDPEESGEHDETTDEPDTFDRPYVESLRADIAKYRTRAKKAEDYAQRLHTELVRATGRLADPADLVFAEEHLEDPEALAASIDSLLEQRPHLKSRAVRGDVNQGNRAENSVPADFSALLRA